MNYPGMFISLEIAVIVYSNIHAQKLFSKCMSPLFTIGEFAVRECVGGDLTDI